MDSVYDRVLLEVGNEGRFQRQFDLSYNILFASLWTMAYNNILLALTVTPHTCKLPIKPENISDYSWKFQHIPIQENGAGIEKFSDCLVYISPNNTSNMTIDSCELFDYDKTWFETTVVSDNNWVCEDEIKVTNILAYSRIGEIVGSLFFGWYGDVYGRKLTYIISLAMLVFGRCLSILSSSSYTLFAIGCVIASFPSWSATQSASVISLEISSPQRRATVAKLRLIATSFGMFMLPFFFWWLKNWRSFLIITTVSQIPYLLLSGKLIESPQWLWINGKSTAALQYLKRIAKVNKSTLNSDTESEILTTSPVKNNQFEILGPLALFSHWRIALYTILQCSLWVSSSANYTVTLMSSGEKANGNPFLDFAWQALAEIPGYFIAAWLADRIGRRYTGIASFSVTTVIWIITGYSKIYDGSWVNNEWLTTILAVTNRSSITVSYYIINLFNMELYPTCLRQSGMSFGNVASGGGTTLAHYILYLGRRVDVRYPSLLLIVSTLFCGIVATFFLPETLNAKLPETLEDAKYFGTQKSTRVPSRKITEELESTL